MNDKVIFRKWRNGDVIAVFPYVAEDRRGAIYGCMTYEHVGQHGAGDYDAILQFTRPAKPEEYEALSRELRSIGYEFDVIKRRNRSKAR